MKNKKYFCVFLLLIFAGKINSIYLQPAADATKVIGSGSLPIPVIDNPATAFQYLTTGIVFASGYIIYKVLTRVLDSNDKLGETIEKSDERIAVAIEKFAVSNTTLANKLEMLANKFETLANKVDKVEEDIAALRRQK